MGTLCLRRTQAPPSFKLLAVRNAEATRGVWGVLPQKILKVLSFDSEGTLGHTVALNWSTSTCLCYKPARAQRKVTVVRTCSKHAYIEIRGAYETSLF